MEQDPRPTPAIKRRSRERYLLGSSLDCRTDFWYRLCSTDDGRMFFNRDVPVVGKPVEDAGAGIMLPKRPIEYGNVITVGNQRYRVLKDRSLKSV